ncbi:hypothetical protein D9619_004401 [Psilocybe cf. subviscida]|uniref:Transmembrane protein n=1 Tax=Psilocybe cf. subviscida TaxID=2480587 RepID=A0A8H5F8K2_9AGAR|nr:hypothetical protein D9619_004401 [Psilocybe cf. subviscida]
MGLLDANFFTSSIIVDHNAFKNIIFRIATITLDFVILRLFGFFAFRRGDYTSFLIFAEDIIQKALFISSRGITARQSLLVVMFTLIAAAGESYDTMLWAIDNPGYVIKHRMVDGATLAAQMVETPAYVVLVSANRTNPSAHNTLNSSFKADIYTSAVNVSLPGVFERGLVEVTPPLYPLNGWNATARIWLDDEGFAVGLDSTIMDTLIMSESLYTMCFIQNAPNEALTDQAWNCNISNSDAADLLQKPQGQVLIWWDVYHFDVLQPYADNPWSSMGVDGGSMMMKQVFTVTKGRRRHTFISTVLKASMSAAAPTTLDDGEISDFMRRTWSPNGTITTAIQELINDILYAKGNNTGRTFGDLHQTNTSLSSISTDYLNIVDMPSGANVFSILRFFVTNTTLIRSETLAEEPTPLEPCPGTVYRNFATGGEAISTNCNIPVINQTLPLNQKLFLGQIDASSVGLYTGFLGDGTSNLSSVALLDTGLDWISEQMDHMDNLLISRALLLGGNSSAVTVDISYSVAAISGLQLFLCILPGVLAIGFWCFTRFIAMSYYQNSFLAAVLTTTHTTVGRCEELGYVRSMPEITLQTRGRHVTLRTPHEGTISNTVSIPVDDLEMVYEPLVLEKYDI